MTDKMTDLQQKALMEWILATYEPSVNANMRRSSYWMKHRFEESPAGFYITNDQFKQAMVAAGFRVVDPGEKNWHFYQRLRGWRKGFRNNEAEIIRRSGE